MTMTNNGLVLPRYRGDESDDVNNWPEIERKLRHASDTGALLSSRRPNPASAIKAQGSPWLTLASGWGSSGDGTVAQGASGLVLTKNAPGGAIVATRYGQSITLRADSVITMELELTGVTNGTIIRIELSSDNFTNKSALLEHVVKAAHGSKVNISIPVDSATLNGSELITNTMNYVGIRLPDASATASIQVKSLSINAFSRPRVIIDFDDGFLSQYTEAFRAMSKYGLRGNIAVIGDKVGTANYVTLAHLKEMYASGWDMLTHGYSTHTALANESATFADVVANYNYLKTNEIGRAATHYVYPGGIVASYSRKVMVDAGMVSARIVDQNVTPTHLAIDEPLGLWSYDISQNRGVANLLAAVDRAIATGTSVRLHGHRIMNTVAEPDNELSVADFATLCDGIRDRIRDNLIDNLTMSEWWAVVN